MRRDGQVVFEYLRCFLHRYGRRRTIYSIPTGTATNGTTPRATAAAITITTTATNAGSTTCRNQFLHWLPLNFLEIAENCR